MLVWRPDLTSCTLSRTQSLITRSPESVLLRTPAARPHEGQREAAVSLMLNFPSPPQLLNVDDVGLALDTQFYTLYIVKDSEVDRW